jgi:ankyrin repeat protein
LDTVLHEAARLGHNSTVICIIENGFREFDKRNQNGMTPLLEACGSGSLDVVTTLVSVGSNKDVVDAKGLSAVHHAVKSGKFELIKFLMENGFNFNCVAQDGTTPLHLSAAYGPLAITKYLIQNSANSIFPIHLVALTLVYIVNAKGPQSRTPLHFACSFNSNYVQEILHLLQESGAEMDAKDDNHWTPLFDAATCGSLTCLEFLIKAGCDVNTKDNTGNTALHVAVKGGFEDCASLLVKSGANVNVMNNSGIQAWHEAASLGSINLCDLLLKNGVDVNRRYELLGNSIGDPISTLSLMPVAQ